MTTCLCCSFQASPLLVFWEPRCLPTMAWLLQLPGFLARGGLLHGSVLRRAWQDGPCSQAKHSSQVARSGACAERLHS